MNKQAVRMVACLLFLPAVLLARADDGGHAGAFLKLGAGARGPGMGGAFTAIANDISSCYWNPAGLAQLGRVQLMGAYSTASLDRSNYYTALAFPGNVLGTIGIGWLNLSIDQIDGRDVAGNATAPFSNSENAFFFSFGTFIHKSLAIGGSFKYLNHSLAEHQSMGVSGDLGILVKPLSFLYI